MENIRKNQEYTLDITDQTDLGFGVGRIGDAVVFVSGAVPGDRARVKIIKVAGSYLVGRCEEVLTPSPYRDGGRCTVGGCHSCAYRDITYEKEKQLKEEGVRRAFAKAGMPEVRVLPLLTAGVTKGYRNKAQYPVSRDREGRYIIGFYAPRSHRVTEAAGCAIAPPVFGDILDTLRHLFEEYRISVYREEEHAGLLRHIYLRRGEVSQEVLLVLVINGTKLPHGKEIADRVSKSHPEIVGVLCNENRERTNVVLGERYTLLWGRDYITDTLCGVELKLAAPAFYQVNHAGAELLYRRAAELAALTGKETLLDLYCGVGSIGLSMAGGAREVIGIDIVPQSIACARENAARAGITNARYFVGDATETEKLLERAEEETGHKILPDVVVLDPPRGGCEEPLLRFIASLSPARVVYISCNPTTLARDCASLATLGYTTGEVTPVDMFPGTGHVETVVLMSKVHTLD